jgi:hypothetical protein
VRRAILKTIADPFGRLAVIPIDVLGQCNKEDEALSAPRDAAPGQDRCLFIGEENACDEIFE